MGDLNVYVSNRAVLPMPDLLATLAAQDLFAEWRPMVSFPGRDESTWTQGYLAIVDRTGRSSVTVASEELDEFEREQLLESVSGPDGDVLRTDLRVVTRVYRLSGATPADARAQRLLLAAALAFTRGGGTAIVAEPDTDRILTSRAFEARIRGEA